VSAYYNEFDPVAAAWLREMIKLGEIAPGDVDERSITDVHPDDLRGYRQCHFFAGIGGWSYAARLAGWPDDRPLWTGSCPCQPFSVAGKGAGTDDPRHLWPHFFRLIRACRPPVVMGEQVAGKAGYGWLDGVLADLAGEDYAGRGVDIPACAVDAPHIRSRLYWIAVADAGGEGRVSSAQTGVCGGEESRGSRHVEPERLHGVQCPVAHPGGSGPRGRPDEPAGHDGDGTAAGREEGADWASGGDEGDVVDPSGFGRRERWSEPELRGGRPAAAFAGIRNGTFWSGAEWIACHDGKARRAEPGVPLLAHGVPARVAKWRGFGNAIVPQVAAEVIAAFLDVEHILPIEDLI